MKRVLLMYLLMSILGISAAYSQKIDSTMLYTIIEKNEKVLCLSDSLLENETKSIRVINLTSKEFDKKMLVMLDPITMNHSVSYTGGFNIILQKEKAVLNDVNTGRFRDIFIVKMAREKEDVTSVSAICYKFKPNGILQQNKILTEFEFVKTSNGYEVGNFSIGAVD